MRTVPAPLRAAAAAVIFLVFSLPVSAQKFTPPPRPVVPPSISKEYPEDADRTRVADVLEERRRAKAHAAKNAAGLMERAAAQAVLDGTAEIELVFDRPVTQQQIDAFLALGGEITHMYRAVSYGWNGRIPLKLVEMLPLMMGGSLVLVDESRETVLHLDTATRTGRARPVWAPGFAGSASGYDGDANITIAIVDSGVSGDHTDLAGRQQYWRDFTGDGNATPVDVQSGHGSHVTGIALGTGSASGSATGTLYYTDSGDLTAVPSGSFYPNPVDEPNTTFTYTTTARWLGGGSTSLYHIEHTKGTAGGWGAFSAATAGTSPIAESNADYPGGSTWACSAALLSNGGTVQQYVVATSMTNYPGVGDGYNKLRGVAPGCRWAGAKVFSNTGSGVSTWTDAALDDLVATRVANNIKVLNMSLGMNGSPGLNTTTRQKTNTAVNNGIVVCCSAGNDGRLATAAERQVDDPGRAALAITVGATNDVNALTSYSSEGFPAPGSTAGQEEDYKPDVAAPGGSSDYYCQILSLDSNYSDGSNFFADQRANDYTNKQGTSMASPFVAGCAALVIDAMQQAGTTWSFASSAHPRQVKMLLCATATETNASRESSVRNPLLTRAAAPADGSGFPVSKDMYEGYGMLNPDAAIEAAAQTYTQGSTASAALGPAVTDRRAWARRVNLYTGWTFNPTLTVPAGGDFDLYLYSNTPAPYGTPVILASSTNAGAGVAESLSHTPAADTVGVLVVKRVSGSGTFSLSTPADTTGPAVLSVTSSLANGSYTVGQVVDVRVTFSEVARYLPGTGTAQIQLETGATDRQAPYAGGTGTTVLVFNYTVQAGDTSPDLEYLSINALTLTGTATIRDAAGNNATLTLPALGSASSLGGSKAIVIDTAAPTVTGVTSSLADGAYTTGQVVPVRVTFNENVTYTPGTGGAQIQLETGATDRQAAYASGSGSPTLVFNYTVQAGDTSPDLEYLSINALTLTGTATLRDAAGNNATRTLPALGSANSLGGSKAIVIDTAVPTVTGVTSSLADGAYTTGQVVPVRVTFNENVTYTPGTGGAQIQLETGTTDRQAAYAGGSGSPTLVFNYTVQAGDASPDLEYLSINALTLTGTATLRDAAGNNATRTLPALGSANSLGGSKAIVIDTAPPTGSILVNVGAAYTLDQNVTLALAHSDGTGSGVTQMRFSNDGSSWSVWEPAGAAKLWTLSAGYGLKTVYAQYLDAAGNVSAAVISDDISYDPTVISITVSPDTWDIGARALGHVGESGPYTVTNNGNAAVDITVRGSDGAGGWTLQNAPGTDAFTLELDQDDNGVYDLFLTTAAQALSDALPVSGGETLGLRYTAPGGDTRGAAVAQDVTVTFQASLDVP